MKKAKVCMVTITFFCLFITNWAGASDRLVLAELFTNTSCSYCYNADLVLDQLTEDHPDTFVAVRYHVWWPSSSDPYYLYNTSDNRARTNYYGVSGVPAAKFDGFITGGSPAGYWNIIYNRFYMDAPVEITLSGEFNNTSRSGTLNISIVATDISYFDELYVRVALTESELYYPAPNGAVWHEQTLRDMIPTATGTPIELEYGGDPVELSIPFTTPSPLEIENLNLVVWLQTDYIQTREVYQTEVISPLELDIVDIDDDPVKLPESFNLAQNYPNPFNATTTISYALNSQSSVDLSIYDITGRKVAQLVNEIQGAGEYQVVWDGLSSNGDEVATGVYFYNLKTNAEDTTKRMVLLK